MTAQSSEKGVDLVLSCIDGGIDAKKKGGLRCWLVGGLRDAELMDFGWKKGPILDRGSTHVQHQLSELWLACGFYWLLRGCSSLHSCAAQGTGASRIAPAVHSHHPIQRSTRGTFSGVPSYLKRQHRAGNKGRRKKRKTRWHTAQSHRDIVPDQQRLSYPAVHPGPGLGVGYAIPSTRRAPVCVFPCLLAVSLTLVCDDPRRQLSDGLRPQSCSPRFSTLHR